MEHHASFGQWLMLRRQTLHLHRSELAARVGCAVVTLRKIEADERRPSRQMAERLADQLAIPQHEREQFIRVARGELPVDRLEIRTPTRTQPPTCLHRPPRSPGATARSKMCVRSWGAPTCACSR